MLRRVISVLNIKKRVVLLALFAFSISPSFAASNAGLEARIERLERMIDTRQDYDLLQRIEQLQETVSQLQGHVELQNNQLREVAEEQRNLYKDIDSRLRKASSENTAGELNADLTDTSMLDTQNTNSDQTTSNSLLPQAGEGTRRAEEGATPEVAEKGYDLASSTLIENTPSLAEQDAYRAAHTLLSQKNYSAAIEALQAYVKQYPHGKYVPNAWYWLGETYLIQGSNSQALQSFQQVIDRFPNDPKAADSLLKLGSVYRSQGNKDKARETFKLVAQRYKGTPVAKLAETQLLSL